MGHDSCAELAACRMTDVPKSLVANLVSCVLITT
jgi:hypothetical protein